jgi:hypothetical protein
MFALMYTLVIIDMPFATILAQPLTANTTPFLAELIPYTVTGTVPVSVLDL